MGNGTSNLKICEPQNEVKGNYLRCESRKEIIKICDGVTTDADTLCAAAIEKK